MFLDQNFPNHPTLRSENPDVDFKALALPYYNSLNSFFDKIEAQYKCKVVIAGHPIANYQNNPFGGRQIFYYKTAELVSSSFAVLLHNSYSVSYPILFDKPICIIANAALLHATEISNNLNRYSIVFKKEIVNTDIVENVVNVFYPVETEIREQYINTFFDTSVKEKNEAILTRHIEKIHSVILNNCLACNRNNS